MMPLYPLTFRPVLKQYLWGGRRLGTQLGKPIGAASDYAESWEVADHPQGQSVVATGPLAGTTLHELVTARAEELLGRHAPQARFPLIFKFLDCQRDLSVQVHPGDAAAAKLTPPDLGKTEAWIILEAQPGSRIYTGLKKGCDAAALTQAIQNGRTAQCLHSLEPRVGDCFFIPAGTVHALGAGLLVAEIQQASDTTYRLYDWDRRGSDGKPRTLHIDEALAAIDYSAVEIGPRIPEPMNRPAVERLAACDKFILDRWNISRDERMGGDDRFHIITAIEGQLSLIFPEGQVDLDRGQTVLVPACAGEFAVRPENRAVCLDMYLPD